MLQLTHFPIDHVAIAVASIQEARASWELLTGTPLSGEETLPEQGVRVAFLGEVELIEPLGPETGVGRFLARRGSGIHHLAFRVPNLEAELERLRHAGVALIDETPRDGARGHRVAFLHPKSTGGILIELVETGEPSA